VHTSNSGLSRIIDSCRALGRQQTLDVARVPANFATRLSRRSGWFPARCRDRYGRSCPRNGHLPTRRNTASPQRVLHQRPWRADATSRFCDLRQFSEGATCSRGALTGPRGRLGLRRSSIFWLCVKSSQIPVWAGREQWDGTMMEALLCHIQFLTTISGSTPGRNHDCLLGFGTKHRRWWRPLSFASGQ
jgi:hypothetical protein